VAPARVPGQSIPEGSRLRYDVGDSLSIKRATNMSKILHGRIRGRTIELTEELGLVEGQEVEVQLKVVPSAAKWGEGILRTEGALHDDPYWDAIMDEVHQERKRDSRKDILD
jgi:hypothetical protein